MYKLDQVSADSRKSHCLTRVLLKELFFFCLFLKHLSAFKTDICSCTKELSAERGQAFPS